ncbi:MAG: hypothetical protein ACQES7_07600 [Pseudomonadota bacterium]|jgi:hypothetical protein
MKYQKPHKPLDERDKLRQFRELDDAFAKALRELEDPNNKLNIPTGPPVRSLATLEDDERKQREDQRPSREEQQAEEFRLRLEALLSTAPLSREELLTVIHTLVEIGQWPLDRTPGATPDSLPVSKRA